MSHAAASATPVRRQVGAPYLTAGLLGLAAVALRVRDPHRHGSWGLCPFRVLTGWDCPGCGGLRAVNDLTHGDLVAATHSHLLLVASLPLAAGLWVLWVVRSRQGRSTLAPSTLRILVGGYLVLGVLFTIVRNTAWGGALRAG